MASSSARAYCKIFHQLYSFRPFVECLPPGSRSCDELLERCTSIAVANWFLDQHKEFFTLVSTSLPTCLLLVKSKAHLLLSNGITSIRSWWDYGLGMLTLVLVSYPTPPISFLQCWMYCITVLVMLVLRKWEGLGTRLMYSVPKIKRQNYSFVNKPQHHHILQIDTLYDNIQQTTPRLYRTDTIEH